LRGQAIDLARERYSIHIPASPHSPSGTYSLLVFVPPWPRAEVPRQWISVLDRYHTILVTAANSGNDAPTIDRREPLALLAAHNTMKQYPVDPQRVYIGVSPVARGSPCDSRWGIPMCSTERCSMRAAIR